MCRKTAVCITAQVQRVWRLAHTVLLLRYGGQFASPLMSIEIDTTVPVDLIRL